MELNNYSAPNKNVGDTNLTTDLNIAYKQVEDLTNNTRILINEIVSIPRSGNYKGAWKANTNYLINDLVTFNNILYSAKSEFKSISTFNNANWNSISSDANELISQALLQRPTISEVSNQINDAVSVLDPDNLLAPTYLTKTFDMLRGVMPSQPNSTYWVNDKGKEGAWILDLTDTTSVDNTGTVIVSANGLRFKRIYSGPLLATWFGVVPNSFSSMTENSYILNRVILANFPNSHIILNGAANRYYIGRTPVNRINIDSPYCIDLIDFSGKFECDTGVVLETETGCTGIQLNRTTGECNSHLINVTLSHRGGRNAVPHYMQNFTLLENGAKDYTNHQFDWELDWGKYKMNGINGWGTFRATNLNISGYPGHGLCIFGGSNIRYNGPEFELSGTIGSFNGNIILIVDNDEMYDKIPNNEPFAKATLNGIQYRVENKGIVGARSVSMGARTPEHIAQFPDGTHVSGIAYQPGKTLLADSIVVDGINNISEVGGCGVFTTGDEANKGQFSNIRIGNVGGHGICDSSLLKNHWIDYHLTQTGDHFSDFSVYPPIFRLAAFSNRGDNNIGSVITAGYEEQGNQALGDSSYRTLYLGGVYPDGPGSGGHGIIDRKLFNCYTGNYGYKWIELGDEGFRFQLANNTTKVIHMDLNGQFRANNVIFAHEPLSPAKIVQLTNKINGLFSGDKLTKSFVEDIKLIGDNRDYEGCTYEYLDFSLETVVQYKAVRRNNILYWVNSRNNESSTILGTGSIVKFDKNYEYQPILNGTFTVDISSMALGNTVYIELKKLATEPVLDSTVFILEDGSFTEGSNNTYIFRVSVGNKIKYSIKTVYVAPPIEPSKRFTHDSRLDVISYIGDWNIVTNTGGGPYRNNDTVVGSYTTANKKIAVSFNSQGGHDEYFSVYAAIEVNTYVKVYLNDLLIAEGRRADYFNVLSNYILINDNFGSGFYYDSSQPFYNSPWFTVLPVDGLNKLTIEQICFPSHPDSNSMYFDGFGSNLRGDLIPV